MVMCTAPRRFPIRAEPAKAGTILRQPGIRRHHRPRPFFQFGNDLLAVRDDPAGNMVGNASVTGTILYGADGDFKAVINNLEDAAPLYRRTQSLQRLLGEKLHNQPRRSSAAGVVYARELGILVVPEGGSFFLP